MAKLKLVSLFLVLSLLLVLPFAFSTHYLVADKDGSPTDVITLAELSSVFVEHGQQKNVKSKMSHELTDDDLTDVAVFLKNGVATVTGPDKYKDLMGDLEKELKSKGIEVSVVDNEDLSELKEELNLEKKTADVKIIFADADLEAAKKFQGTLVPLSEATTADLTGNVIIIGGPCVNKHWSVFDTMTCDRWPFEEGQGAIITVKKAVLVAGTTKEDTLKLAGKFLSGSYKDGANEAE